MKKSHKRTNPPGYWPKLTEKWTISQWVSLRFPVSFGRYPGRRSPITFPMKCNCLEEEVQLPSQWSAIAPPNEIPSPFTPYFHPKPLYFPLTDRQRKSNRTYTIHRRKKQKEMISLKNPNQWHHSTFSHYQIENLYRPYTRFFLAKRPFILLPPLLCQLKIQNVKMSKFPPSAYHLESKNK